MFFKKYGDIVVSIFFMVLSAVIILMALQLPKSQVMDIGPDFMPIVISAVSFILAAILLVQSLHRFKRNSAELEGKAPEQCDYKRVLLSIILVLIYVCVMKPVGFIVSTLAYLVCQMYVLAPDENRTKKDIILLAVISVIFTLVVYFLFRYGFKILMPAGILAL